MEESKKIKKEKEKDFTVKEEKVKVKEIEKKTLQELSLQAQNLYKSLQQQKLTATELLTMFPEHKDKNILLEIKNNLEQ